ncbi:hypothetical protein L596_020502 [Steinernema carpocapsae]|uniref:Uncharacterized protein n=1 Tax=Steinernema carpocapsae TaxID=34508 RepID=A0A4U5MTR4_STECR|nr:hypothetical protein L596_020502 [Steinernema carpocapsae]
MVLLLFLILLAREVTSQVNEDFVGGITVLNKAAQDLTRRFPSWRPHREDCEKWNEWQNATCWWPSQNWEELPEACTVVLTSKKWPTYFQKLVEAKAKEKYDMIQAEYKARGSPPRCGFCSQSFKCRVRNTTDDSFFCPKKQVLNMPSECNDSAPCLISREKGGCPPPFFLNNNRIQRIRGFIERKDHQQVMKELLAAQAPPREDRKGFESSDPLPWEVRTRVKRHPMVNDNSAFDKIQFDLWGNPLSGVFAPRPVSELFGQDEIRMMPRPVPVMPMAPSSKSQRGHGLPMRPMRRLPRPVFGAPMSPQGPMGPLTPQGPQMPAFAPPPFVMNDHATIQMLKRRFGPFGPQILPFGPTRGFFPYFPPPPMPRVRPPPRGIRRPFTRNLQFIHELVHGTTCVSQMNVCLCCCGRYVPNVVNGTCEDITKLLPGIEGVVDDLVEKAKTEEEFKKSENSSEEANEKSKLVEEIKVTVPFEQTGNDDMMMPQLKQMKLKLKPTAKVTKMSEEFKL